MMYKLPLLDKKAELPELTPVQLKKLRQLTIVSLATKSKVSKRFVPSFKLALYFHVNKMHIGLIHRQFLISSFD